MPENASIVSSAQLGPASSALPIASGVVSFSGGRSAPLHIVPEGVVYQTSEAMPSLEELLQRNEVAYTVFERQAIIANLRPRLARVWLVVSLVSLLSGVIAGLAFALTDFPISPGAASFAVLGSIVLIATFYVESRTPS